MQPTTLAEIQTAETVRWISNQHVKIDFITTPPHAVMFYKAQEWGCNGNMEVDIIILSTSCSTVVKSQHESVAPVRSMLKEIQQETAFAPLTG